MTEVTNPAKMDDMTVKKLEEAFAFGADVSAACLYANISRTTYYNWIHSFPEWEDRFNSLRETTPMLAYKVVHDELVEGKAETAKWLLERKRKDEFSTKSESKVETDIKINLIDYNGDNSSV